MRPVTIKLEENISGKLIDIHLSNNFDLFSQARTTKAKINKWNHQTKKLLYSKENHQQNEEAIFSMGEDICK